MSAPKIVFGHYNGFVTDMGGPLEMTRSDGAVEWLPRYGVWKVSSRAKWEVVLTTNDLDEAIREAKRA